MQFDINRERLAECFTTLCEIDSPSREEAGVFTYLKKTFTDLGADEIIEDSSSSQTGSKCNNMLVRFHGNGNRDGSIFFSTHMDTVQPAIGVEVERQGDLFLSAGDTILGSDDKSGIAPLIELIHLLKENGAEHNPIEFVFTTCEEVGLLGAKHFDFSLLTSKFGYALDSEGINKVIVAAPAANKIKITVNGMAAHAGMNPEDGINALKIAAQAISEIPLGRLDEESTSNFGIIRGGMAQNIVPETVEIEGEVRSHSKEKLEQYTSNITDTFERIVNGWHKQLPEENRPSLNMEILSDYPPLRLEQDDPVIRKIHQASLSLGMEPEYLVAGGGSDANIFNAHGFPTAILATGMTKVHTTDECCNLDDLETLTKIVSALVTV